MSDVQEPKRPTYDEMAEAIVYMVECFEPDTENDRDDSRAWEAMHDLADRLRRIGGEDE